MAPTSPTFRLADQAFGGGLIRYLGRSRDKGMSWRRISRALYMKTEGAVDVSEVTLQAWHEQATKAAS